MSFFEPVDHILNAYHDAHDIQNVEIKVDLLRPFFQDMGYVDRIIWEEFDFTSKYILAQIKTYQEDMGTYKGMGDYARIQVSKELNYCWKRFIICKEMYHCLLDKPSNNRIIDTSGLLQLSDYLSNSFLSRKKKFTPHETELNSEVMALETLFPYELRRSYCDDYDNGKITSRQLALRFRIPEEYIQTAMVDTYFTFVHEDRNLINF